MCVFIMMLISFFECTALHSHELAIIAHQILLKNNVIQHYIRTSLKMQFSLCVYFYFNKCGITAFFLELHFTSKQILGVMHLCQIPQVTLAFINILSIYTNICQNNVYLWAMCKCTMQKISCKTQHVYPIKSIINSNIDSL